MVTMTAEAPEFVPSRVASPSKKLKGSDAEPAAMDGSGNDTVGSSSKPNAPVNNRKRPLANPSMVPQAPRIPKTAAEKETAQRLYVVLSQACLETYQVSSGGGMSGAARRDGRFESNEPRYTLLNCDDHVSRAAVLFRKRSKAFLYCSKEFSAR